MHAADPLPGKLSQRGVVDVFVAAEAAENRPAKQARHRALPESQVEALYEACRDFEDLKDIREITKLMETKPGAQKAAE
jgi:hypothetical protein